MSVVGMHDDEDCFAGLHPDERSLINGELPNGTGLDVMTHVITWLRCLRNGHVAQEFMCRTTRTTRSAKLGGHMLTSRCRHLLNET